jgi:hypothetical protein
MITFIVIFFISIAVAFGMLTFRAWQIKAMHVVVPQNVNTAPRLSFRQLEKIMLYLTKHIVQGLVLVSARYWFIFTTKTKKWLEERWPKIHSYFHKNPNSPTIAKPSFVSRAILESKAKIKKIKENVKKQQEEKEVQEEIEK